MNLKRITLSSMLTVPLLMIGLASPAAATHDPAFKGCAKDYIGYTTDTKSSYASKDANANRWVCVDTVKNGGPRTDASPRASVLDDGYACNPTDGSSFDRRFSTCQYAHA